MEENFRFLPLQFTLKEVHGFTDTKFECVTTLQHHIQ